LVKLGIRVSPRTVRRYLPSRPPRASRNTQEWSTFVRNHAGAVLASDFFVVVTVAFRLLYALVAREVGTPVIRKSSVRPESRPSIGRERLR
jgi:putative transposase